MPVTFTRAWWVLVIRGLFGVVLGVFTFVRPFTTMHALVLLFGVYAIIDGIFAIGAAIRAAEQHTRWWPLVLEGIVGLAAGIGALVVPGVTALALVTLAGAWALVTGVLELMTAIRLRRRIRHEWALGAAGVLSIVFGIAVLCFPVAGAVWFVLLIGSYALVFGLLFIMVGIQMRAHGQQSVDVTA